MEKQLFCSPVFTKRRTYTKSAEIELKPYGNTLKTINDLDLIEKDREWLSRVNETYPLIDKYLISRIDKALAETVSELSRNENFALINANINSLQNTDKLYSPESDLLKVVGKKPSKKKDKKSSEDKVNITIEDLINAADNIISDIASSCIANHFNEKAFASAEFLFGKEGSTDTLPVFLRNNGDYEGATKMEALKGTLALYQIICANRITAVTKSVPKRVCENFDIYIDNMPRYKTVINEGDDFVKQHEEEFSIYSTCDGYLTCITAEGIAAYNRFISGISTEDGIQEIGYNGYANEHNHDIHSKDKKARVYQKADKLKKQILYPVEKQFSINSISTNDELIEILKMELETVPRLLEQESNLFSSLDENVVIDKKKICTFSNEIYGNAHKIEEYLAEAEVSGKDFTIGELATYCNTPTRKIIGSLRDSLGKIIEKEKSLRSKIESCGILTCDEIKKKQNYVDLIVQYVDNTKEADELLKLLHTKSDRASVSNEDSRDLHSEFRISSSATNLIRNFITKSPKKEARKERLLFDTPAKLGAKWWTGEGKFAKDENTVIRMDSKYYFFTLAPDTKPVSFYEDKGGENVDVYSCKKAQKAFMKIPATLFTKEVKEAFKAGEEEYVVTEKMTKPIHITRDIYEMYEEKRFTTGYKKKHPELSDEVFKNNIETIAGLYIELVNNYTEWSKFDFSDLMPAKDYADIGELCNDIDSRTISMEWTPVSREQIDSLVNNGEALMFLVTAMNMYVEGRKKRRPAQMFLSIFSDDNKNRVQAVMNSKPAVFYRKAITDGYVTHKKGSELVNKIDKNGNFIPDEIYMQLYRYFNNKISKLDLSDGAVAAMDNVIHHKADFDIIKNRRYSEPKFILTYSYTLGKDIKFDSAKDITLDVNDVMEQSGNIMAVIRGTKDLLYYVIQDKNGEIIKYGSLNKLHGVDYYEKLRSIDFERKNNKSQHWKYDSKSADIKDAYIAAAVSEIAEIAYLHNAIIVVEDIYEKSREKWACIDYQIFGKFVNALVNKLSTYYIKGVPNTAPGGLLNPLQLSYVPGMKEFDTRTKGIVNKISDSYIRNVDFATGFVSAFNLHELNSAKKIREFFSKFDSINLTDNCIQFLFNYDNFKCIKKYYRKEWTVNAFGKRSFYNTEKKKYDAIDDIASYVIGKLKENNEDIKFETTVQLKDHIDTLSAKSINLLFQVFKTCIYGVVKTKDEEYYISPIMGEEYYDWMKQRAMLLIKKYLFIQNTSFEEIDKDKDGTKKVSIVDIWVEYLQSGRLI